MKKYGRAIKVLEQAMKDKTVDVFLYKELGYAWMQKRDYDNTIIAHNKGLGYFPDRPEQEKGGLPSI